MNRNTGKGKEKWKKEIREEQQQDMYYIPFYCIGS